MFEFKLPDIGEGLAEAELLEWNVTVGDEVAEGDIVATVSTDKVNVELNAPCAGKIAELGAEIGDVIEVGTVFLRIDDGAGKQSAPVRASPAVRRYAAENAVDLAQINGSGPGGMVRRQDIDAHLATAEVAPPSGAEAEGGVRRDKLAGARLKAARNLARSAHTMATTTISWDSRADRLLEVLDDLAPEAESRGVKLSPLALISKCVAKALTQNPRLNANVDDDNDELVVHEDVDLGVAVATDDGLVVPVLRHVDRVDIHEVAATVADIAGRGRSGTLGVADMQHSTFTLSSTGGFEKVIATSATPVINYPNVAMLWTSRITERPWAENGELKVAHVMSCTLAFDHRYLHGSDGFAFINDLNALFQDPSAAL